MSPCPLLSHRNLYTMLPVISKGTNECKGRTKILLKCTSRSSDQQLRADVVGRCSEIVLTTSSIPTLPLCCAEGTCTQWQPHSLQAQNLCTHIQHSFSKMQMTAAHSGLSCLRWADPAIFTGMAISQSFSNSNFSKGTTAERWPALSLPLASVKAHVSYWKLRRLKRWELWNSAAVPGVRRRRLKRP